MCSLHSARHAALFYASDDASFEPVIDFLTASARERVLVMTTSRRWDDIAARLQKADINWMLAVQRGTLVIGDAAAILDRTVRKGLFERTCFDAELRALMGGGDPPERVYSEAASTLVGRDDLPAALALERVEQEIVDRGGTRICCGFALQQFPEAEQDWQVRSIINAHQDAVIAADGWTRPVAPAAAQRLAKDGELVLLWDNHSDTRNMYAEALAFSGYRVMTAGDAWQAFTLATAYRPDVLVFDLRLPAKAAVTTMRRLRATAGFTAPILALTAHALRQERADIVDEEFDAVLAKPCLPDALVAAVASSLSRRRHE